MSDQCSWSVVYSQSCVRTLKKLDPQIAVRIRRTLVALAATGDPRSRGKALTGRLSGLWRYRVGDDRVVCALDDGELTVLVIDLGHRSDIY